MLTGMLLATSWWYGLKVMTKQIVAGLVAHVDAGKTTLTEALLYQTGRLRKLGRVDKGNAFLDPDRLEKKRGITIFAHQAMLNYHDLQLTLLDTPGHIDFAAQTEQVLPVLDYAVLLVTATDGIQSNTRTLWSLLHRYQVPTFIFINKADSQSADPDATLRQLQDEFSSGCLDFSKESPCHSQTAETIALQDEEALDQYLDNNSLSVAEIQSLIKQRKIFPCYTGSALKMNGVTKLLDGLQKWTVERQYDSHFAARVFKITHDTDGNRLTWIRLTGGMLYAKDMVLPGEKADQLRVYNGTSFTTRKSVSAGEVCTIAGLASSYPGQGLGWQEGFSQSVFQPVLSYTVKADDEQDPRTLLSALRKLADEDPQLKVSWTQQTHEIHVHLMGEVQRDILAGLLLERYHLHVSFGRGQILYRETIDQPVEGVGHFEPLRHYAEVHLLLEPGSPGSGLQFASRCREEVLSHSWQQQVMTSLAAKKHRGVLIGAPLTDVKITLVGGKGSIVHSVGGDFREATWRAVRQGLMMLLKQQHDILLEPWYRYRLTVPQEQVGRAINDLQQMGGNFKVVDGGPSQMVSLTGRAPVAGMQDYAANVRNYSHGRGQLDCVPDGFHPCHNTAAVIADRNYQPTADLDNTPDSVFCAHGAGYPVKWNQVPAMAHFPYLNR